MSANFGRVVNVLKAQIAEIDAAMERQRLDKERLREALGVLTGGVTAAPAKRAARATRTPGGNGHEQPAATAGPGPI